MSGLSVSGTWRRTKYGSVRTTRDGTCFASKAEADYYGRLKMLEKSGEVSQVVLQPSYPVIINGIKVFTYRADFSFYDVHDQRFRVVDVKGYDTPISKLKRKCVKAMYDIDVEVVRSS
ncbi:DUF1064 domain-containing protein [Liberibacter crescens]|nr:DUF1064 domain-containing protein [Liberibacter crescens]AMC13333.1 hypothetical protein RL73_02555 [Liberibacter crescens]